MKRYTAPEVLATEFCWDIQEVKDYRYQPGRSDRPIYTIANDYYCACKIGQKPARHRDGEFEWVKYDSKFANSIGWQIWQCKSE